MIEIKANRAELLHALRSVQYPSYKGDYYFTYSDYVVCWFTPPNLPLFGYNASIDILNPDKEYCGKITAESLNKIVSILSMVDAHTVNIGINNHVVGITIVWQEK